MYRILHVQVLHVDLVESTSSCQLHVRRVPLRSTAPQRADADYAVRCLARARSQRRMTPRPRIQAATEPARPASHPPRSRGELLCNAKRARGEPSAFCGTAGPGNGRVVIASVAGAAFLGSVESLW